MDFSAETSKRLQNGAQLVSFRAPQLNTIAFSVVLPFVPEATPGVYHLVEHMFFERAGERRAEERRQKDAPQLCLPLDRFDCAVQESRVGAEVIEDERIEIDDHFSPPARLFANFIIHPRRRLFLGTIAERSRILYFRKGLSRGNKGIKNNGFLLLFQRRKPLSFFRQIQLQDLPELRFVKILLLRNVARHRR